MHERPPEETQDTPHTSEEGSFRAKKEPIDQLFARKGREESDLEEQLIAEGISADDPRAYERRALLSNKHRIEEESGMVFELEEHAHAWEEAHNRSPGEYASHPEIPLGEVITVDEEGGEAKDCTYMGLNEKGQAVLRPQEGEDYLVDPKELLKSDVAETEGEDALSSGDREVGEHEQVLVKAEPPPSIEGVSQPADIPQSETREEKAGLDPELLAAMSTLPERSVAINALKKLIKENPDPANQEELNNLRDSVFRDEKAFFESPERKALLGLAHASDDEVIKKYHRFFDGKLTSEEAEEFKKNFDAEKSKYKDAQPRKNKFLDEIEKYGIERNIGGYLYGDAAYREGTAKKVLDALEQANSSVLKKKDTHRMLEWFGIDRRKQKDEIQEALRAKVVELSLPLEAAQEDLEVSSSEMPVSASNVENKKHETPDVNEVAAPEMIQALRDAGISIPEGKVLTAFEAVKLLRKTLGGRGTTEIAANEEEAQRQREKQELEGVIAPEIPVSAEVPEVSVEQAGPVGLEAPEEKTEPTLDAQGKAMQHLIDNTSEVINLGKTELTPEVPSPQATGGLDESGVHSLEAMQAMREESSSTPENGLGKKIEKETQEKKELPPLPPRVIEKFTKEFNITSEDLQKIEGFGQLSEGQQMLVLRNMENEVLRDVEKSAKEDQKVEWGKRSLWGKIWRSAVWMGGYQFARTKEIEKELLARARGADVNDPKHNEVLADHLADVEEYVKVMKEGPDVEVKQDGTLDIKYISPKDVLVSQENGNPSLENQKKLESFNVIASEFSKLPREWGYEPKDGKGHKEYEAYEAKKNLYDNARAQMLNLYREKFAEQGDSDPEKSALLAMHSVDERLELNQLFNAHPDVEQALTKIEDQNVIAAGAKEFWQDKGKYIALGAGIRIGAMVVTGGIISPLVTAVGVGGFTGGLQGRNEARKLIRERRIEGRMSEEDEREEIEYIRYKNEDGARVLDKNGMPLVSFEKRKIKEYTDSTFFVDRISRLATKLEQATDGAERALLEKKIVQTTALMEQKFENGLINFGGSSLEVGDERKGNSIANRLSFIQAMGKGRAIETIDSEQLAAEMARITNIHQEKIEEVRKKEITKACAKAGMIRAGFAFGGAFIAQEVKELLHPGSSSLLHELKGVPDSAKEAVHKADTMMAHGIDELNKKIVGQGSVTQEAIEARIVNSAGTPEVDVTSPVPTTNIRDMAANRVYEAMGVKNPSNPAEVAMNAKAHLYEAYVSNPAKHAEIAKNLGLSEEEVAKRIARVLGSTPGGSAAHEAVLGAHTVAKGENLTHILLNKSPAVHELNEIAGRHEAERTVQNILQHLKGLSLEELKKIFPSGDPNVIRPGDKIDLNLLESKIGKVVPSSHIAEIASKGGKLGGVFHEAVNSAPSPSLHSDIASAGAVSHIGPEMVFSPLSPEDAAQFERLIPHPLSGTESHVIHSLRGLVPLAESHKEQENIGAALAHLLREMRASGSRSLSLVEMQRILHEHNGLDAKIKFTETPSSVSVDHLHRGVTQVQRDYTPPRSSNLPLEHSNGTRVTPHGYPEKSQGNSVYQPETASGRAAGGHTRLAETNPVEHTSAGDAKLTALLTRHENSLARIDLQEAQRMDTIKANYQSRLEQIAMNKEQQAMNRDMGTVQRGIGQLPNILQGGNSRGLGQVIQQEAVGRMQGSAMDNLQEAQSIKQAQIDYDREVRTAQRMFEQMRANETMNYQIRAQEIDQEIAQQSQRQQGGSRFGR